MKTLLLVVLTLSLTNAFAEAVGMAVGGASVSALITTAGNAISEGGSGGGTWSQSDDDYDNNGYQENLCSIASEDARVKAFNDRNFNNRYDDYTPNFDETYRRCYKEAYRRYYYGASSGNNSSSGNVSNGQHKECVEYDPTLGKCLRWGDQSTDGYIYHDNF